MSNKINNSVCSLPEIKDLIPFKEIEQHVIGSYSISDWFSFLIHSDKSPYEGDKIQIADNIYEVESVVDATDDDDFEQGLSYSKVQLCLYMSNGQLVK